MGKKRSQNEVAMKKTIQKLIEQRDEARRQTSEVLEGKYILKSEHVAITEQTEALNKQVADRLRQMNETQAKTIKDLEQQARDGNRHVYAELDLARGVISDLQEALKNKSEVLGEHIKLVEQLRGSLLDAEMQAVRRDNLIAALEKQLSGDTAADARATRLRLQKKTAFVLEQQSYIGHLERTLRLLAQLPAVQDYLQQVKVAIAQKQELSRVSKAVLETETIETKRPVEGDVQNAAVIS